jgi:hypothetical protein
MVHLSSYGHYWPSYDQWTVSSVEVCDFGRFSWITPSIYMIFTKFVFEKTYFVKKRVLMVHLSTYGRYWLSYDWLTVSSVGFRRFWPFFPHNFLNIYDNQKTSCFTTLILSFDIICLHSGSKLYCLWIELWLSHGFVRWVLWFFGHNSAKNCRNWFLKLAPCLYYQDRVTRVFQ